MTKYYLVMGEHGEYSSIDVWPVALYRTEAEARAVVEVTEATLRQNVIDHDVWLAACRDIFERLRKTYGYYKAMNKKTLLENGIHVDWPPEPVPQKVILGNKECSGDHYWVEEVEVKQYP